MQKQNSDRVVNQSKSDYETKEEEAATIEDKDEEDKEYMEVLKAEEADSELDLEMD